MKLPRRQFLNLAAGAAALPAVSRMAAAQTYPTRPIRIVVGYTPGGAADIMTRIIGQWLSERLGQSVIIENKPGGGTNLSVQAVLGAAADGSVELHRFGSLGVKNQPRRQQGKNEMLHRGS